MYKNKHIFLSLILHKTQLQVGQGLFHKIFWPESNRKSREIHKKGLSEQDPSNSGIKTNNGQMRSRETEIFY